MNSKIVITGKNKTLNDKFSQRNSKRSSKSKFEDIELGSTIGEIYRKSRSKSAVSHRKKHDNTKMVYKSMINVKPVKTKQYYKNNKPEFQESKVIKLNKNSPTVTNKSNTNRSTKSLPAKLVKSPHAKLVKSPHAKLVKSPHAKLVKSPPKKLVKLPTKNTRMNKKMTIKSKKISSEVKKNYVKQPDYKTVKVKTNVNSYLIPDNIVSKNILNSDFNNNHHFTQFTDSADRYLIKVISGGIDINKYQK